MTLKIVRFVNLILAGLLAGNEFGTWAAVHRSLWTMPTPEHIRAEQALTRHFKSIMPFWMSSVVVSCLSVLALTRDRGSFRFTLAGTLCFAAMMVSTLRGNMPINNRTLELSPEETPPRNGATQGAMGPASHATRYLECRRAVLAVPGSTAGGGSLTRFSSRGREAQTHLTVGETRLRPRRIKTCPGY